MSLRTKQKKLDYRRYKRMCLNRIRNSHCRIWHSRIVDLVLVDVIDDGVLQQISNALAALQSSSDSRRTNFVRDPFSHDTNVVLENKEKSNFAAIRSCF